MLITISAGDIAEYHGEAVPAFARLYARDQFTDTTGMVVAKGSKQRPEFYQEFEATLVGNNIRLLSAPAYSTTDSNNPGVTYLLVVYDGVGREIYTSPIEWRIPPEMNPTTWATLEIYSRGRRETYAPTYLHSNAIVGLFNGAVNMALKASDVIFGATKLDTLPTDLAQPTAVGTNSPLVGLATTVNKGRLKLDTAPADPNEPIAVGPNSPLVTTKASEAVVGKTMLSVPAANPAIPIALGSNDPVLGDIEKNLNAYASVAAAVAAIGAVQTNLIVKDDTIVPASVTIPENITVDVKETGILRVAGGQTLTIGSLKDPGNRAIFGGGGTVKLARGAVDKMNLTWWAGATDGIDVTAHINEMLLSCVDNGGGTIFIPDGLWLTAGNHILPSGTTVRGGQTFAVAALTNKSTILKLTATGVPAFKVGEQIEGIHVKDFTIDGNNLANTTGILCEGEYPNSSGNMTIDRMTFIRLTHGVRINSLPNITSAWQMAHVSFRHCTFTLNTHSGIRCNTVNSQLTIDTCNFGIIDNAWGIYLENVGSNHIINPEFAGLQGYFPCSGGIGGAGMAEGCIYIGGAHAPINITGGQDEACRYYIYNDASDMFSPINVNGALVQSVIMLAQSCVLNLNGSTHLSKTVKDLVGSTSIVNVGPGVVVDDRDVCNNVVTPPVLTEFAGASIVQVDLNSTGSEYAFRLPTRFFSPQQDEGSPNTPVAGSGHHSPIANENKVLWRLGRQDAVEAWEFYYDFIREYATGRLKINGNQALPNRGFEVNADFYADGAIRSKTVPLVDGATMTIDPSLGNHFWVVLGGNRTLEVGVLSAAEQTRSDGQQITVELVQDATGSRTITLGASIIYGTTITDPITATVTAAKRDILTLQYSKRADKWMVVGFVKGFA
jgi:hypothetical protein